MLNNDITFLESCSDEYFKLFFKERICGATFGDIANKFKYSAQGVSLSIKRGIAASIKKSVDAKHDHDINLHLEQPSYESLHAAKMGEVGYCSALKEIAISLSK
ncbi:hypothetical protein [Pseudoalteromonas phage PS_L5]|nr:hypothetical protein [Pseudoalteromonas phage PS_L5]